MRPDPSHSKQSKGGPVPFLLPYVLAKPQELNLSSYALNNPIILIDPWGLKARGYNYGGQYGWMNMARDLRQPPGQCDDSCKTSHNDCYLKCTFYYQKPFTGGKSPLAIGAMIFCIIRCLDDRCRYDWVTEPLILI